MTLSPAAQRYTRIIFQDALISAVGISGILYLYAKVCSTHDAVMYNDVIVYDVIQNMTIKLNT